jgi:MoaD family protein
MLRVNVRYHALLRETTAREGEFFELQPGGAVAELLKEFERRYPAASRLLPALKVAVNEEIAGRDAALRDGDNVDLFPPFGGG